MLNANDLNAGGAILHGGTIFTQLLCRKRMSYGKPALANCIYSFYFMADRPGDLRSRAHHPYPFGVCTHRGSTPFVAKR